jgi:hypothetical protein
MGLRDVRIGRHSGRRGHAIVIGKMANETAGSRSIIDQTYGGLSDPSYARFDADVGPSTLRRRSRPASSRHRMLRSLPRRGTRRVVRHGLGGIGAGTPLNFRTTGCHSSRVSTPGPCDPPGRRSPASRQPASDRDQPRSRMPESDQERPAPAGHASPSLARTEYLWWRKRDDRDRTAVPMPRGRQGRGTVPQNSHTHMRPSAIGQQLRLQDASTCAGAKSSTPG